MVETFTTHITPYGLDRNVFLYLPDGWQTSGRRYPVVYMFDGHNLFLDSTATYGTCWGLKEYLDAHPDAIVAAPECNHEGDMRLQEYCPYDSDWFGGIHGTGQQYLQWLVQEFKPYIDAQFPTLPGRELEVQGSRGTLIYPVDGRIKMRYVDPEIEFKPLDFLGIYVNLLDLNISNITRTDTVGNEEIKYSSTDFTASMNYGITAGVKYYF